MTTMIGHVPGVGTPNATAVFIGTEDLQELTVINTLLHRRLSRQGLDSLAGGGNGLALISDLRDKGLTVTCDRIEFTDCQDEPVSVEVFTLTAQSKRIVNKWIKKRDSKFTQASGE
jgi:hypothetical protein